MAKNVGAWMVNSRSTVAEHSYYHFKVKGVSPALAASTERDTMAKKRMQEW